MSQSIGNKIVSRIYGKKRGWVFTPNHFLDLGNTTYTPDFYLPEFNTYIEIKGYWRIKAKRKMKKFLKIYNYITLYIFNQEKLTEIGVLI